MTHDDKIAKNVSEFQSLFTSLNDKNQTIVCTILQTLDFAQTAACSSENRQSREPPEKQNVTQFCMPIKTQL